MKLLLSMIGVCFLAASAPAQELLFNGSFELGIPDGVNWITNGSTNIVGWTIAGPRSLYIVTNNQSFPALAADGATWVDLNGAGGGVSLSQSFSTIPGETYEVKFSVGLWSATWGIPGRFESVTAVVASSNGVTLATAVGAMPDSRGWSNYAFQFIANTATSTLSLTDTNGTSNYDLMLDAVSVRRVTPAIAIERSQAGVQLCWDTITNSAYQLQCFTNEAWADLGTPVPGSGARYCTNHSVTAPQQLFRVVRLP